MNRDRIAQNLAAVENHFHSEALNEVEAALETFTDDVLWEAPALNGLATSGIGGYAHQMKRQKDDWIRKGSARRDNIAFTATKKWRPFCQCKKR